MKSKTKFEIEKLPWELFIHVDVIIGLDTYFKIKNEIQNQI